MMQLVVVKFRDPTTFDYWATVEETDKSKCNICFAVGLLLEENDDIVKVALLCSEDRHTFRGWVNIPGSSVLSCDVIKEVDWEVLDV